MKLKIEDIIDRHKGKPAVVCGHGPSLGEHKQDIESLQKQDKLVRFSVNNWYDYFSSPPDYWVLSNTEPEYHISLSHERMNEAMATLIYSIDGDPTPDNQAQELLNCDYLPYDQRHFKHRDCKQILNSFITHHRENNNFSFNEYGNNEVMWHPPKVGLPGEWGGFDPHGRCCPRIMDYQSTIQEELQKNTNHSMHYSPGDTVAVHAIAFAVLMGCNPIYTVGIDLDYEKGYANRDAQINWSHLDIWVKYKENLLNDLNILNESAKNKDIEIINLIEDAWYGVFNGGNLKTNEL